MKNKILSNKKLVLLIEIISLITLIFIYKISVYILKINNLSLMNLPIYIFTGIFIILAFLIMLQISVIIYNFFKNPILKAVVTVTSIIASVIYFSFIFLSAAFLNQPEHIVEKDNKKMVAYVNSFLQVKVNYYDYINPFVRGNKLKINEDYGNGGYDPFEIDEMPSVKNYTYYDDDGKVIKSTY